MPAKIESGLTDHRTEFVREDVDSNGDPETPTDPGWLLYADVVKSYEWTASAAHEAQRGLGEWDPATHFTGPEEHQITVVYDMQQWPSASTAAEYDGLTRDSSGYLPATHTFVDREDKGSLAPNSTVNGSTSHDTRLYTVGRGGYIDEVSVTGDPGSQQPIEVELTYEFEKVRTYQVDQPSASGTLDVVSDAAGDTTQTLTIEDEGASTTEDVSLNGTTAVTTTASFANIDAIELDASTEGTITISETGGDDLAELRGTNAYDNPGGYELGIPALGSGSHASALNTSYETFLGDTFTYAGSSLAMDINSFALTVSNNTERTVREESVAQRVSVGNRNIEVAATVLGEKETHRSIQRTLANTGGDIVWTLDGGTFTVGTARLTEPGPRAPEAENPVMTVDNTFTGESLTIS